VPVGLALIVSSVFFLGCSGSNFKIETQQDYVTDFATFKTWNWYEQESTIAGQIDPSTQTIIDGRVRGAVEYRMDAKGYRKVEMSSNPHMLLAYHVIAEDMNYKSAEYSSGQLEQNPDDNYFKKGTLVIDIVDPQQRKLIWRGKAQGAIEPKPRDDDKVVRQVVDQILQKFPPKL
jgi:hypothetical protein